MSGFFKNRISKSWFLLVSALAVHVIDEGSTGFLSFYNELVLMIRNSTGFFPMPTFQFQIWLGGLILSILIFYSITHLVGKARGFLKVPIAAFGVLMILNGCGHIAGSVYFGRVLPGFWSSFLLIPSGIYLMVSLVSTRQT